MNHRQRPASVLEHKHVQSELRLLPAVATLSSTIHPATPALARTMLRPPAVRPLARAAGCRVAPATAPAPNSVVNDGNCPNTPLPPPPDCSSTALPVNAAQGCLCHSDFITHHPPSDPCPGTNNAPPPAGGPPACTSGWLPGSACYCACNTNSVVNGGNCPNTPLPPPPDCSSTTLPVNAAQGCLCHSDFITHHPPVTPVLARTMLRPPAVRPACTAGGCG